MKGFIPMILMWFHISVISGLAISTWSMGLLPDTQNCRCACAGNAGNVFPVTAGARSRHASRHVRHARAVMHVGIANLRFPLKSAAGENVPGIPGACATCNFTYLVRGPWSDRHNPHVTNDITINGFAVAMLLTEMRDTYIYKQCKLGY